MLYLIKSDKYIKVGYTKDWTKRLQAYKTHNPNFKIIAMNNGYKEDEKALQFKLVEKGWAPYEGTEWFTHKDKKEIKEIKKLGFRYF